MARNLASAGHEVRVWNRTRAKAEETGLEVLGEPTAEGADVLITMLADGAAVDAVMDGVTLSGDQIWWQSSTVKKRDRAACTARRDAAPVDDLALGTAGRPSRGVLTVLASGRGGATGPVFDAVVPSDRMGHEIDAARRRLVLTAWVARSPGVAESIALAEGLGLTRASSSRS
jgi:3-hydroxyisobutyrate dehydrogenase